MARITIPKPKHVPHAPEKPTKTPMPEVKPPANHGTWQECKVYDIEDTTLTELQSARCSACGKYHTTPYLYYFEYYKFCPCCGAKMGEQEKSYFPKGFFSKERPLAKGEDDETD